MAAEITTAKDVRLRLLTVMCICVAIAMSAGCRETRFGDMTAARAFAEPKDAQLAEAAAQGKVALAERLIRSGANVRAIGADGVTPLIWAVAAGDVEGVKTLLVAGADPNHKMSWDISAMSIAVASKDPTLLALLLQHKGDPNLRGASNEPLLHRAVRYKLDYPPSQSLDVLLEHGADINILDSRLSAADSAIALGRFDIAAYLLEKGLTINLQDLAWGAEMRALPPQSEQNQWKAKVIEMLKERGAKFPALKMHRHMGEARTDDNVAAVFAQHKEAIYLLYKDALKKKPGLTGKVVLKITIDADGNIIKSAVVESTLGDSDLLARLSELVSEMKFGRVTLRSNTTFLYPMEFIPASGRKFP